MTIIVTIFNDCFRISSVILLHMIRIELEIAGFYAGIQFREQHVRTSVDFYVPNVTKGTIPLFHILYFTIFELLHLRMH